MTPACGLVAVGDESADRVPVTLETTTSTTTPTSTTERASNATTIPPTEIVRPSSPSTPAEPTAGPAGNFTISQVPPSGDPECRAAWDFLMAGLNLSTTSRTAPPGDYAANAELLAQELTRLVDSTTGFLQERAAAFTADLQQFQLSAATSGVVAIRRAGDVMLGTPRTRLSAVIEAIGARCPDVADGVPGAPFFRDQ